MLRRLQTPEAGLALNSRMVARRRLWTIGDAAGSVVTLRKHTAALTEEAVRVASRISDCSACEAVSAEERAAKEQCKEHARALQREVQRLESKLAEVMELIENMDVRV